MLDAYYCLKMTESMVHAEIMGRAVPSQDNQVPCCAGSESPLHNVARAPHYNCSRPPHKTKNARCAKHVPDAMFDEKGCNQHGAAPGASLTIMAPEGGWMVWP